MKVFRKTGVSTLINILGMSVAFAAAMILMVQVRWDTTYDANFEGHGQVFRLENNWMDHGLFSTYIGRPFIEMTRDASPNIEAVCTWQPLGDDVLYKEGDRESPITIPMARVDSSFFSIFPVEWVEGSAREFEAARTIVINDVFAEMIFGEESAVGKVLENGSGESGRIIGVFRNTPRNFSAHVGILSTLGDNDLDNFSEWSYNGYLKLKDPSMAKETEDAIYMALGEYISSDEETRAEYRNGFRISQIHEAHFERDVRANIASANKAITVTLAAIAILLILIAIINFINFAFAEIPFRIKNINTRKVLGEGRGSLIGRQLIHAGLIASVAFAIAALIMHVIAGTSWASHVSDSIALKDNTGILILTLGIALFSAVVAGIAPALFSTAQPAALVLKGSYAMSVKGKMLRNVLVGLQFVLSFIFILMALYVHVQTKFMMSKDMGFPQENILQVWCGYSAGAAHKPLKDKLLQNPSITDVTFSDNLIVSDQKMGWGRTGDDGEQIFMEVLPVTEDFVRFFDLQIVDGRDFRESDNEIDAGVYIANETFITEIVGIVKDFNFKSLQHAMGPLVLLIWGKTQWRDFGVMYVKTAPESDFKEISDYIKEAVCAFDPSREPDQVSVRHLDEWIENMYQSEQSLGKLITIASFVALLIAIIGIIGLVFFETQFLRKEIAVRRVNGATVGSILKMINKKYLIMAGASFVIAAPVAYWLMTVWRKGFAYQTPIHVWIFIVALLVVAAITVTVVTLQSWKAANANPADALQKE